MMRSVNETLAMALKAARGAGIPLGHAEEFAAAIKYVPTAELGKVVDLFSQGQNKVDAIWSDDDLKIANAQVIMAAPVVIDGFLAGTRSAQLIDVDAPSLFAAYFAHAAVARGISLQMMSDGSQVVVTRADEQVARPHEIGPRDIPMDIWAGFDRFARRTYVPATEASRLAGAGAGLTDND